MGIHQLNSFWHLPRAVEFSTGLRYPPGGTFLKLMVSGPWPLSGGERAVKFRRWTSWAGEVGFVQTWGIHPHSMAILRRNRVKGYSIKKLPGETRLISFSWWFCDSKRAKYFDLYLIHPLTSCNCVPGSQKWQSHVRRHQGVCGVPGSSPARAPDQRGMLENLWETSGLVVT